MGILRLPWPAAARRTEAPGVPGGLALPVPVTETPDELVLHAGVPTWARTFVVRDWPRAARLLWAGALAAPVVFRVRFTAVPSGFRWTRQMQMRLRRVLRNIEHQERSDRAAAARPEEVGVARAIQRIRDALLYQGLRPLDVWCLVTVLSDSRENLEADAAALVSALQARGIEVEPLRYGQAPGFAGTLPVGDVRLRGANWWPPRTGVARAVARAVPADIGRAGNAGGIYAGHATEDHYPVTLDFRCETEEMNTNCVVLGASGEGKSTWLKAAGVVGALLDGWHVLVFDVDGEYRRVCEAVGGLFVDLSGASGRYPDPCRFADPSGDPREDADRYDRLLAGISRVFAVILGDAAEAERAVVEQEAVVLLARAGVDRRDPATWSNDRLARAGFSLPAIYRRVAERAAGGDPWAAPVAQKLWRYFEGSLAPVFEDPLPMLSMPARLVVLHLGNPRASAADAQTAALKYTLAVQTAWEWLRQNKQAGRWTMVVADEGQRALQNPILAANLADLATTIRKWNGTLMLATNAPGALWEAGYGDALWNNSHFKVVFALEEAQLNALAHHADLPQGVVDAIRRQLGTKRAVLRIGGRGWVQVRLALPPEELALYRTRRGGGGHRA